MPLTRSALHENTKQFTLEKTSKTAKSKERARYKIPDTQFLLPCSHRPGSYLLARQGSPRPKSTTSSVPFTREPPLHPSRRARRGLESQLSRLSLYVGPQFRSSTSFFLTTQFPFLDTFSQNWYRFS